MKKLVVSIIAGIMMFGGVTNTARAIHFEDIVKGSYYHESVSFLYYEGITRGISIGEHSMPDKFGVGHRLTRETAVTLLMRGLGYTEEDANAAKDVNFKDVNKNSYYYKFIKLAHELGIVSGVGNGKFEPQKVMTRAEMAVIIDKAYKLDMYGETAASPFVDLHEASWAAPSIKRIYRDGITSGTSATMFSPNQQIPREDFAVFLYKAIMKDNLRVFPSGRGPKTSPDSILIRLGSEKNLDEKRLNFNLTKDGKPIAIKKEVVVSALHDRWKEMSITLTKLDGSKFVEGEYELRVGGNRWRGQNRIWILVKNGIIQMG
jgi:hypothetical protein